MVSVRVPGFLPSVSGLRFANAFPAAPFWRLEFRGLLAVELGNVGNGLCGGMSYLAADLHATGEAPPDVDAAPGAGSPLQARIKRRQTDSFDRGWLPLRFWWLGLPFRPRTEAEPSGPLARAGIRLHSRTWLMVAREWPEIRRRLDAGRLVPLGLLSALSVSPLALTANHQVLAYGYDLDGSGLTLLIYDPNWPGDDGVTITLDVGDPGGEAVPVYSRPGRPLHAFFRAPYRPPR